MLTSIQSAGVAPEVNLRNSAQARKPASEKSTLALKPRADVTRSPKQGPQKRTHVLQKIFKKKRLPGQEGGLRELETEIPARPVKERNNL